MEPTPDTPIQSLVSAVVDLGGPLTSIVGHMAAAPSAPDAASIDKALAGVLQSVLAPLRRSCSPAELDTAARVLSQVTDRIVDEVMIVPFDG